LLPLLPGNFISFQQNHFIIMKKIQYNYRPADSAAAGKPTQTNKSRQEETERRLNALAREYPFCAWGRPRHNTML
jgi:hypothetical protein